MKVYDGLFFSSTVSLWNKLPLHIVSIVNMEQFFDLVSDLDLQHFTKYLRIYIQCLVQHVVNYPFQICVIKLLLSNCAYRIYTL